MIIIPTYNERKNLGVLVARIRALLPAIPILFVDDNSPDGTSDEIKILQELDKNIHLLARPSKLGFASAYLEGLNLVLAQHEPEFVVTMDADLSHPPEKLVEMIGLAKNGKVAIGSRYTFGGQIKNWGLRRRILSRSANFYARLMTKLAAKDLTSGFIAMPTEKLKLVDLDKIQSRGYAFLIELKNQLSATGSEFAEVPIIFEERKAGESKLATGIVTEGIKYTVKLFWQRQVNQNLPAWLIFFISLAVYIYTLPRTIFFGDSPEFMTAGSTLGIAHPPGYPAYALLAKLFTYLPFGNLEFRLGIFSAVCGSLSLVIFYFLFYKISKDRFGAFLTALILGFSAFFWSQAVMAKVYMPMLLLLLVILLLIVKFWETKQAGFLLASLFLFGFGSGMHQLLLLFLPLLFVAAPKFRFSAKQVGLGALLLILGLGVYAFIPLRERHLGNGYDFAQVFHAKLPSQSFSNFMNYFLRTEYRDFAAKFSLHDKLIYLASFFEILWQQFYWLMILIPLGLFWLWRSGKKFLVLTVGVFLINVFGIILLRSSDWNIENGFLYSFYYLPAIAMAAIWIGLGLIRISEFLVQSFSFRSLLAVGIIFPVWLLAANFNASDLSRFTFVEDYTRTVLESLPQNALLLIHYQGANTDTLTGGFIFQQKAKHLRPDVKVMNVYDIHPEVERVIIVQVYSLQDPQSARYQLLNYVLKRPEFKDRPIYTSYLVDGLNPNWSQIPNGLVYKFKLAATQDNSAEKYNELDFKNDLKILESNLFGQDLLAQYFYGQAAYWASKKDLLRAQGNFINGIKYDYKPMQIDQRSYMTYRNLIFAKP